MTAEEEFYLLPLDEERFLAFPAGGNDETGRDQATSFAETVSSLGPVLAAFLNKGGVKGGRTFEMSPESERIFRSAGKDSVGTYFRGVLRGADGKVSHQVQLREVKPVAAPPSALAASTAVQMAAIQAQLTRMEDTLNDVAIKVENIGAFLEEGQRARLKAALKLVNAVYANFLRSGRVGEADWDRVSGAVELEVEAQLAQVSAELTRRLSRIADFRSDPKASVRIMQEIDPQRVCELVELHRALIGGLRRIKEIVFYRKIAAGELDAVELEETRSHLAELMRQHTELIIRLEKTIAASRKARPRSNFQRLWSDGIFVGEGNDRTDLGKIDKGRRAIQVSIDASQKPKQLPPASDAKQLDESAAA